MVFAGGNAHATGIDSSTSPIGGILILANSAIGAGILAFPAAFHASGGLAVGITLLVVSDMYLSLAQEL